MDARVSPRMMRPEDILRKAHWLQLTTEDFAALDPVFRLIRQCEDGRDAMGLLKGPVCHAGFKRLA